MKHKLEWRENPSLGKKAFSAISSLEKQYRLIKQKGRWVDESEVELLEIKRHSWSNLSDAKKALQNRENRLLKNL